MATAALTGTVTALCNSPFLVKQFTYTAGATTSTAITHGELAAPDVYFGTSTTNTSPGGALMFPSVGATTLTIATITDAAGAGMATLIWLKNPGTGGLNPP